MNTTSQHEPGFKSGRDSVVGRPRQRKGAGSTLAERARGVLWTHRLAAAAVSLCTAIGTVAAPNVAVAAPSSSMAESTEVKSLNDRAQREYDRGEFAEAARAWTDILGRLPENRINREERETTLLVALDAYIRTYEVRLAGGGAHADRIAVQALRKGVQTLETYESAFAEAYGPDAQLGEVTVEVAAEIRGLLADATANAPAEPAPPPRTPTPVGNQVVFVPPPEIERPNGLGLIVGGSAVILGGLAATSMIVVGATMNRRARRDRDAINNDAEMMEMAEMGQMGEDDEAADPNEAELAEIDRRGKRGNALIISGSILTGVLLAGGATMVGFGTKRRITYLSAAPALGPRFVGVSLQGRF